MGSWRASRIGVRLALLTAGTLGAGCAALDRESYSLVLRKKTHGYRQPGPSERPDPGPAPSGDAFPIADSSPAPEAFRPFAYCHRHGTSHTAESLVAVGVVPIEYPAALVTNVGYNFITGTATYVGYLVSLLFPGDGDREPPRKDARERPQ